MKKYKVSYVGFLLVGFLVIGLIGIVVYFSNQLLLAENNVSQGVKQIENVGRNIPVKKQSKVLDAYGELFIKNFNKNQ